MRLEKRPGCRLLSPLPERPIQASNNHCSNTAAYLYTFYQKFEPHSKNKGPPTPHSGESRNPSGFPPAHPSFPRTRESRPRTATNPYRAPTRIQTSDCNQPPYRAPTRIPRAPTRIPREGGGPRRPQDDQASFPPQTPSFPPAHPSFPRTRESRPRTASNPRTATPPRIPREGGGTRRPPQSPPKAHLLGVYARSNSCRLMPRSRRIPWTVPVARSRLACRGTVV